MCMEKSLSKAIEHDKYPPMSSEIVLYGHAFRIGWRARNDNIRKLYIDGICDKCRRHDKIVARIHIYNLCRKCHNEYIEMVDKWISIK